MPGNHDDLSGANMHTGSPRILRSELGRHKSRRTVCCLNCQVRVRLDTLNGRLIQLEDNTSGRLHQCHKTGSS